MYCDTHCTLFHAAFLSTHLYTHQVYNSIPPSTENQQRHLIAEVVARECCPNTLQRVKETRANVVCTTMYG